MRTELHPKTVRSSITTTDSVVFMPLCWAVVAEACLVPAAAVGAGVTEHWRCHVRREAQTTKPSVLCAEGEEHPWGEGCGAGGDRYARCRALFSPTTWAQGTSTYPLKKPCF